MKEKPIKIEITYVEPPAWLTPWAGNKIIKMMQELLEQERAKKQAEEAQNGR